jgi:fibronectin type 3 domain-containing protein
MLKKTKKFAKKISAVFMIFALLLVSSALCSNFSVGFDLLGGFSASAAVSSYTYTEDADGITITGYVGVVPTTYAIPAQIDGKTVVGIGEGAFRETPKLKYLTIPGTVKRIEGFAFEKSPLLTKVTIEDGTEFVGQSAFSECSALTTATFPDSVTEIETRVFYKCILLSEFKIPANVKVTPVSMFSNCEGLAKVTIPDGVETLGFRTFYNCKSLTKITIPDSVIKIDGKAFENCKGLTSLKIPATVTQIDDGAFIWCAAMKSITLPPSITKLGEGMFKNCSVLSNINIPESVTEIGPSAFEGCLALNNVVLPNSVESLGDFAFVDCSSLSNITLSANLKSIGQSAFSACTSLKTLTIPANVENIGENVLRDSTIATAFSVSADNPYYSSSNGMLFNKDKTTLIACPPGKTVATIPEVTKVIAESAFYDCKKISVLNIPNSVEEIGTNAFFGCTKVSTLNLGTGLKKIGDNAFSGLSNITALTLPQSLSEIGDSAFYDCDGLKEIKFRAGSQYIGPSAFADCGSLTYVYISSTVNEIGDYAFATCPKLTKISVSADNAYFKGSNGLLYNKNLTKLIACPAGKVAVSIPSTVTSLANGAFMGCEELNEIVFKGSIKEIGDYAFKDCKMVFNLQIPATATKLGVGAYQNSSIKHIDFPVGITAIPEEIFDSCTGLTTVVIPNTVTKIGEDAFAWCDKITAITVPDSVTEIGDGAFGGCDDAVIYCYKNSVMYNYAVDNELTRSLIGTKYLISDAKITLDTEEFNYTGLAKKPVVTVKYGIDKLVKDTDFTVEYLNNTRVGIGKVIIKGKSNFTGATEKTFLIKTKSVSSMSVESRGATYIELDWSSIMGAYEYAMYKYDATDGLYKYVTTATDTSYKFTGLKANTSYKFAVRPKSGSYMGFYTYKTARTRIATPTNLTLTNKSLTSIKLNWSKSADAVKYEVYRATSKSGKYYLKATVTTNYYTNTALTTGKTYYYKVKAVGKSGTYKSFYSAVKYLTAKPMTVTGVAVNKSGTKSANVSWTKQSGVTGYAVYRATSKSGTYSLIKNVTTGNYNDTSLTSGKTYYYKVRAYKTVSGKKVYGNYSEIVSVKI